MKRKQAHLTVIQAIINRMSIGSVLLRAWSVLIVAGLLAVAADPMHARFAWLAVFMAIAFWMLDAHFLRQTRLFRKTYVRVQSQPESAVDFLLDTTPVDSEADAWRSVLLSKMPGAFYGAVIGSIAAIRWLS
jgi:hypothetical protein